MIEGIIFDLDGVICSTDEYHYMAWKALAEQIGIANFTREDNKRQRGVSRMESLEVVLEKSDKKFTAEEKLALAETKNEIYKKMLLNMSPADLSGEVKDTLDELRARGLKLAIGSSSKNTPMILERLGLGTYFDAVADGNCITHSKPDPEVFLKAAEMLGLEPCRCIVVEDAAAGIQAGRNGGFLVAGIGGVTESEKMDFRLKTFSDLLKVEESLRRGAK